MSLDRKILERIERENLGIKPKWFFALKNLVFGIGAILASILGSLSLALLFEIIARQGKVPYVWVILLGVFLLGGYRLVTKIDSLYKIKFVPIVSMLFFISLSFGWLTFASGKAEKMELALEKVPIYDIIIPISKEKEILFDVEEKIKPDNKENNSTEEIRDDGNNEENHNDGKSADNDDEDKVIVQESKLKIEIMDEENDDDNNEIKAPEKTSGIDGDDDDSVKGEVKGVNKEAVEEKSEAEEGEEIEEEKADSDNDIISTNDDNSEESESDVVDDG
jgi:hypothetical protein